MTVSRLLRFLALTITAALSAAGAGQAAGNGSIPLPVACWRSIPSGPSAMPDCTDSRVQSRIVRHFADVQSTYWNPNLAIVSFENVRTVALRRWDRDYTPRHFCVGDVRTSDGRQRDIHFMILDAKDTPGADWGVEFCLPDLDR